MSTLVAEVRAQSLVVTEDNLIVDLSDGRSITVPLAWYPRLIHGTAEERNNWRWNGDREGIHWPDLDEDISVENLLLGQASGESPDSFRRWVGEPGRINRNYSPAFSKGYFVVNAIEAREVPEAFPPFFLQLDCTDFPRRSLPKGPNGGRLSLPTAARLQVDE